MEKRKVTLQIGGQPCSLYTDDSDEYISASLEDFLNLHNGLFLVNTSAEQEQEMTLLPPETSHDKEYHFDRIAFALPIMYPFGTLHFVFSSERKDEDKA